MKTKNGRQRWARWAALMILLPLPSILSARSNTPADNSQITKLLTGLCDHSVKPSDALDPSLTHELRDNSLAYFTDPSYQLSLVPVGPIQINEDGSATVSVKVEFKDTNKEMSTQTTAQFVKRNEVWYFANFSFLAFPTVIVVVIIICGFVGVLYAVGVLIVRGRLVRQGRLELANRVKVFIPVFWPSLFNNKQ